MGQSFLLNSNPPETCKTTVFRVPEGGIDPRGLDIGTDGVVWTALAASSHLASFDVRKCKSLTPAKTDGSQCPEGWTMYQTQGPRFKNTDIPTDFHYYNWVDQHNISGLGANTPFATGSNSDALLALLRYCFLALLFVFLGRVVFVVIREIRASRAPVGRLRDDPDIAPIWRAATREVIVSGGTVNSPKLLELSGIGNPDVLQRHGIRVVQELKGVGENLRDHPNTRITFECSQPLTINDVLQSPLLKIKEGLRFIFKREGLLTICSATAQRGVPTLPAATVRRWLFLSTCSTSLVVVVLPSVPVMDTFRQSDSR